MGTAAASGVAAAGAAGTKGAAGAVGTKGADTGDGDDVGGCCFFFSASWNTPVQLVSTGFDLKTATYSHGD